MLNHTCNLKPLVCAVGLAAVVSHSQPVQALKFGSDDVGTLETNTVVWVGGCTGTLIAPDIVITAGHCIGGRGEPHEDALPQCADWQVPGRWYPLTNPVEIKVGHDRRRFTFVTEATDYNMPGCREMMMLRLDEPVPDTEATPVPVLVSAGVQAGAQDAGKFAGDRFTFAGWGWNENDITPVIRQTGIGLFSSSDNERMYVFGSGGEVGNSGDSGGPLFWTHPSGRRFLIGVLQSKDLRYTPTFLAPNDGKPGVGEWIRRVLPSAVYCPEANSAPKGTVPLVSWWSPSRFDNFTTGQSTWAGCEGTVRGPDYEFVRTEGFIFNPALPQPEGTVTLYSWYDPYRGDNVITSHPSWQHWPGDGAVRSPNYRLVQLEGFVFDPELPQPEGTIPLYSWYDPYLRDNWTTTQYQNEGDWGLSLSPNYGFSRLEGYLYPVE